MISPSPSEQPGEESVMAPRPSATTRSVTLRNRLLLAGLGVVVVVLGWLVPVLLEPTAAGEAAPAAERSEMGRMLLRLVGGTASVLVLCVGTLWLCRRWLVGPAGAVGEAGQMEVVESLQLRGGCRVLLVKAAGRSLLAGV